MHIQWVLVQAYRHRGQGGIDDGGIQRLHKEAKGNDPQLPAHGGRKRIHDWTSS